MKETSVARSELKYTLPSTTAARLRATLDGLMRRDPMGGRDGYSVRSLYFDTLSDGDYYDKVDGLETRQKVRLRIYTPDDATAKLELKKKMGAYQWKRSLTLSRDEVGLLMAGRYGVLRERTESKFAREFLSMMEVKGYVPRTLVEYRRLAFVAGADNTRVTFDSDLRASQAAFDLFSPAPAYHPIPHPMILEVKYTHYLLSHIKFVLGLANQMQSSVSKYCLGRQISFF